MITPLYIIPARGGSKGIPHKNIRALAGKPLIAYTIAAAKTAQAASGGRIILSTDDDAIADAARNCGLEVDYMRPAALGGDTVGSREVILDVMDWADREGIPYDCVVLLQPTSPLREASDILNALALYTPDIDMVVTVCHADSNPYFNMFEPDSDGYLHISKGDGMLTRRQDAPPVYEYNGAVYVINPQSIREMPLGAFPRRIPSVMDRAKSIDLDTPAQWAVAENLMRQ